MHQSGVLIGDGICFRADTAGTPDRNGHLAVVLPGGRKMRPQCAESPRCLVREVPSLHPQPLFLRHANAVSWAAMMSLPDCSLT